MLLPSIYKDSLEGGAASLRPFLAKRWTFSTRDTKTLVVATPHCSVCDLFLPSNSATWLCFLSVCFTTSLLNILHHLGDFAKPWSARWRTAFLWSVASGCCYGKGCLPLGNTSQDGQSQPPFLPLLHILGYSDTHHSPDRAFSNHKLHSWNVNFILLAFQDRELFGAVYFVQTGQCPLDCYD